MNTDTILVLLVEDNEAHTALIQRAFATAFTNHHLVVAKNLEEAYRIIRSTPPNLIIADLFLPDGRGINLLHFDDLAQDEFEPSVPVVIMTSQGDQNVAVEAMKAGAMDYIVKSPETFSELPRITERTLRAWKNIRDRYLVEKALMESEERYRSFVQNFQGIAYRINVTTQAPVFFQGAVEEITGYSEQDFLDSKIDLIHLIHPDDVKTVDEEFQRIIHSPNHQINQEVRIIRKDGEVRWVQRLVHAILNENGSLSFLQGVMYDITDRKRMESEIRESNRKLAEALNEVKAMQERVIQQERLAAVGQLAAGIAHDFNNTIMAITVYTELMMNQPKIQDNDRKMLTTILDQAQHASDLTQQILDFSRRSLMRLESLDLGEFLQRTKNLLQHTIPENIQTILEIKESHNPILGDESRLQQAFVNLALNAKDAMPDGGMLTVEISHRIINETNKLREEVPPGKWICLTFKDTGTGISKENLPHIFEPFFTTKEVGKGSGLGLAQVYGIIKQHHGYIFVESELGQGTTFTIFFPIAIDLEHKISETKGKKQTEGSHETILVVEDNESTREAICAVLESLNYHVVTSNDGAEALKMYENEAIDLVLSDLVMPGIGGLDLYKKLKELNPDVKMVIITGYPLDSTDELLNQGILAWAQKPLTVEKIAQTVRDALA